MTKDQALAVIKKILGKRFEVDILDGYSGRGMFGSKTTAVAAYGHKSQKAVESYMYLLGINYRTDTMGRDGLVYY